MKNEILYFTKKYYDNKNGGNGRDIAFFNFMKNNNAKIIYLHSTKYKILTYCIFYLIYFNFLKNKKIFIHLSGLLLLYPSKLLKIKIFKKIFVSTLEKLSKNNKVVFEINDLPVEQSKDIGIKIDISMHEFQKFMLSFKNVNYIFASNRMSEYSREKYFIEKNRIFVCINGGNKLNKDKSFIKQNFIKKKILDKTIKFIYAGTLEKGRGIEKLIKIFSKLDNATLILIGEKGEWIKEENNLKSNIVYLGSFEDVDAVRIANQCDMGLIPYNSEKFYYNLCYPTKVSFYIVAGIPILMTPLKETKEVLKNLEICEYLSIDEWEEYIKNLNKDILKCKKIQIRKNKFQFEWNYLIEKTLRKEVKFL